MTFDYSLEGSTGVVIAHRPDCPAVRALADGGEPVATMLECKNELPDDVVRHECLTDPWSRVSDGALHAHDAR